MDKDITLKIENFQRSTKCNEILAKLNSLK